MNEILTSENLKNGGLTLALLYSIYINYKMSKDHAKIISNHINHASETQIKLTNAVEKLIRFLENKFK
mgnify:CR=1 FL=1